MKLPFELVVRGKPEPRGSKQPFVLYKNRAAKEPARREDGSIIVNMTDDNAQSKAWMETVAWAARSAWHGPALDRTLGIEVACVFFLERPGDQHGTGRNARFVKESAPARPRVLPDLDKLARGTLDALTGIVWWGDQQIVGLSLDKRYAVATHANDDGQGVVIKVDLAQEQHAADLPLDLRERWLSPHGRDPARDAPGQDSLLVA